MGEDLNKKLIVISAINFFEGGPLTILKDNLKFANEFLGKHYKIIALVHKVKLMPIDDLNKISFIEFPESRKSYLTRLYLEYFYFKRLSKKWKPHLWLSLHDITPNVTADIRAVYCHNSTPFKQRLVSDLFFQPTVFFFSIFYKLLYRINIKKNDFVIVQQIWMKNEFLKIFKIDSEKTLVCYPDVKKQQDFIKMDKFTSLVKKSDVFTFFYPALARPFKNFEVIGEAIKILENCGIRDFKVIITIKGDENNYAKHILKKYGHLNQFHFVGMLSFNDVNKNYLISDALLFPSTLETWGLPITEFKAYEKPIILSKLPYAFETLGSYDKGCFFNPLSAIELADKMLSLMNGNLQFDQTSKIEDPILTGWSDLYNKILAK